MGQPAACRACVRVEGSAGSSQLLVLHRETPGGVSEHHLPGCCCSDSLQNRVSPCLMSGVIPGPQGTWPGPLDTGIQRQFLSSVFRTHVAKGAAAWRRCPLFSWPWLVCVVPQWCTSDIWVQLVLERCRGPPRWVCGRKASLGEEGEGSKLQLLPDCGDPPRGPGEVLVRCGCAWLTGPLGSGGQDSCSSASSVPQAPDGGSMSRCVVWEARSRRPGPWRREPFRLERGRGRGGAAPWSRPACDRPLGPLLGVALGPCCLGKEPSRSQGPSLLLLARGVTPAQLWGVVTWKSGVAGLVSTTRSVCRRARALEGQWSGAVSQARALPDTEPP